MDVADALLRSWKASEERLSDYLSIHGSWRDLTLKEPKAMQNPQINADYYQNLHDQNDQYQTNNWLMPYVDYLSSQSIKSIVELGTGNGRFAFQMSEKLEKIYALDWAASPSFDKTPPNLSFIQTDLTTGVFPTGDLVCSADVLEHFSPNDLTTVIDAAAKAANRQFHVVACYDDGHSHLTVMPPAAWLCLFRQYDPNFRIHTLEARRNDPKQIVCSITNL